MALDPTREWSVDDVGLWIDPGGGVTIKAVTAEGDPVELTAGQARELAAALLEAAALDSPRSNSLQGHSRTLAQATGLSPDAAFCTQRRFRGTAFRRPVS